MTDIDKLIRMNVELEGLLKVLRDRDSLEARDLLSEKIEEYTSALNAFLFSTPEAAPVETTPEIAYKYEEAPEEAPHAEIKHQEAQEAEVMPEEEAAGEAVEKEEAVAKEETVEKENTVEAPTGEPNTKLLKAFTLNDRFRFRRELFAGDDEDFQETLKLLADMDSYAEACDYLYNDMMWDRKDPAVEDFMAIVAANTPQ